MKVRQCRLTVHFFSGPTQRDIRPTGEFLETSFQAFPLLLIILSQCFVSISKREAGRSVSDLFKVGDKRELLINIK